MTDEATTMMNAGGKRLYLGNGKPVWYFGWNPPVVHDESHEIVRNTIGVSKEADKAHKQIIKNDLIKFKITGNDQDNDEKVCLFDVWKHPEVVAANGSAFGGIFQKTGSCFPAGTPVRMADGSEKPIEEIRIGDYVITHTGKSRAVVNTFRRQHTGQMVTIRVAGFPFPLEMTADHQVATMASDCNWRWQPKRLEWKRADNLEIGDRALIGSSRNGSNCRDLDLAGLLGDKVVILDDLMDNGETPASNVWMSQYICRNSGVDWHGRIKLVHSKTGNSLLRHVPVSPSLARLIGLYLAEGGCDAGRVTFTFSSKEEILAAEVLALVRGLFGVDGNLVRQADRPTVLKVRFNNVNLEAVFKALVPGNVYSKRVPGIFFTADESTKLALILGWLDGDGYAAIRKKEKKQLRIQGITVSGNLARDMATIALSIGIRTSVSIRKARKQSREAYDVFLSGPKAHALYPALASKAATIGLRQTDTDTNITQFGYARAIRSLETRDVQNFEVYDFEVEEDHSFLANGLTVHNCVGAGGGNVIATLAFIEVIRLGDPEQALIPFWLLPYGRSRFLGGMRGPGEGSNGSFFAEAMLKDGVVEAKLSELPQPSPDDGMLTWGSSAEMKWSDGGAVSADWLAKSRKHLVKSAAKLSSADQVRDAIRNGFPVTCASMYAHRPSVTGTPPVLLGRKSGEWSHQMSIQAWWKHPSLGEIFWLQNQWGGSAHGSDPAGGPPGGVWITKADVDWICRDEVYAFSQFDGFPATTFDWSKM